MKAISNNDLANFIDNLPQPQGKFEATAFYDPDGDCIEFLFASDDYYAERIDDLVTVYYSRSSGELIGSMIKNVKDIERNHPGVFAISVEDGRVVLRHLFVAAAGALNDKAQIQIYKKLAKFAEDAKAEAELCGSAG